MAAVTVLPHNRILQAQPGENLHALLAREGLLDAPCGGQGTCGKCAVLADGRKVLACRTGVSGDMTVTLPQRDIRPGSKVSGTRAAFDIGTTTVVCYLTDARGNVLAQAAAGNPQGSFGADAVSRIRAAQQGHAAVLMAQIRRTMAALLEEICENPREIELVSVAGNPAMQQLFLGLSVENLAQVPFRPVLCEPTVTVCGDVLPLCPEAKLLTVPDISGFVGADTVAGILARELHRQEEMTLLVDIGTNGEMVLGNRHRLVACAAAAGPALEGANISCGMRAEPGAIHRVRAEQGQLRCSVLGGGPARGICGSGLVDAVAAALDLGLVNRRGRILTGDEKIMLTDGLYLTQADIRQVQLAKGAICAGIRLMAEGMSLSLDQIPRVLLAGAFGSSLDPENAVRTGLLPRELQGRITPAGSTAGKGAVLLAADPQRLADTREILEKTEFLELASLPAFPKTFARAMEFSEDWCRSAMAFGFTQAAAFDPAILQARQDVRAMCQADKCHAYGKNWTCPPHCGTLEQCQTRMGKYRHGILLQTVGQLKKDIDSRGCRETEQRHLEQFQAFCDAIRHAYPDALCLGTGGCRMCKSCAWPESCRFPEKAISSMEAYGLFVTQVCRDCGVPYNHGPRTITYTACVLYS